MNKKGFTLVELLVAATILGVLAVFATTSYRNSVAENRWAHAQAMTNQLAGNLQRVKADYPVVYFNSGSMVSDIGSDSGCPFYDVGCDGSLSINFSPVNLISCEYVEGAAWTNTYFNYLVCGTSPSTDPCQNHLDDSGAYPLACVTVKNEAKVPADYKSNIYCVYETGEKKECRTKNGTETCISQ